MVTTLTIVLAVLIAVNVWLMISAAKRERERRKLLQERMDEFDDTIGELTNNLGKAKERVREGQSMLAAMKKDFQRLLAEHEDLKLSHQRAVKERDDVKEKYSALLVKRADLLAEIERLKEDPVYGGEPAAYDQPGDPAGKPLPDLTVGGKPHGDPHSGHQEPVDGGGPKDDVKPVLPKAAKRTHNKKMKK